METPVNAPLKEKFRLEIAKLRDMTFKSKLEYLWEYYKIHFIALIIFLFIVGSLINTLLINPNPEDALFISWNAGFAYDEQLEELSEALKEQIVEDAANETVTINRIFMNDDDPQIVMASLSQLVAMVSAGVIDVFILDASLIEEYSQSTIIQPMEGLLASIESTDPAIYERIMEEAKYAMYRSEDDSIEERLMGIRITSSPLLSDLGFFEQELFFSTSITAGNLENTTFALVAFFE